MKPRNLFGFGASFTLAAIYSRGTCRPTRRPTAVRAASQTAPAVCPRSAGVRAREAGLKQPEKMVRGRPIAEVIHPGKWKAPQSVCFAGLIYPGSYLLSRDLSSDYHRRADVSLPGSEWDRVGPSGYDHQALDLLRISTCLIIICACGLLSLCWLPCGSRLTSAWLMGLAFPFVLHSLSVTFDSSRNCLSPG